MITKKIKLDSTLIEFGKVFFQAGYKAYLVGGAVRDMLMKVPAHDWDVATNATPQDVIKLFKFVVPTGIEHGTVTVHYKGNEIEVTTFRTEAGYSDGRHPDSINYAATIEEDLARRDFTMNAIAVSPMDRINTSKSVGILESTPTPLNTCVMTETINASTPIIATINVMF